MKPYCFSILFLIGAFNLHTQSITAGREVIANAGGFESSGNLSLSWTLGETITETLNRGRLILTQGFQQPNKLIIPIDVNEIIFKELGLKLFPNPAAMEVTIQLDQPDVLPLHLHIFNLNGQLMETKPAQDALSTISIGHLPDGPYLLQFLTKDNQLTAPVKLQKITN